VLVPLTIANAVYCLINSALLAGVLALAQGARVGELFRGYLVRTTPSYLGYGYFGLMIAVLWVGVGAGPLSAVLVLLPLLIARWAVGAYAREQEAYEATIRTLIRAVETKDEYTRGHSERVARGSVMIGRVLGLAGRRLEALRYAGILHDVGKLGVPTRILQKAGRLTDEEFAAVAEHPRRARDLLVDLEFLGEAQAGILHHHERLDGRGYPMGLRGDQIPEFARIIAVADAFDSMTSTRSYRGARSVAEAVAELQSCSGAQFDPQMVAAMLAALEVEPWESRADQPSPRDGSPATLDHDDPTLQPITGAEE
jgi:HD-GYP domain-containing protein (c-di-GMP phosphodiesterase class II)